MNRLAATRRGARIALLMALSLGAGADAHAPPKIEWPLQHRATRLFPDRVHLLQPLQPLPPHHLDLRLTWCDGLLEAWSPPRARSLWPKPVPTASQPTWIGAGRSRLLLATPSRLFALNDLDGSLAWQVGDEPPPDPHAAPESTPSYVAFALADDRLFAATDRREIVCVERRTGNILWRASPEAAQLDHFAFEAGRIAFAAWLDGRHVVHVLNAQTGRQRTSCRLQDRWPVLALAFAPDRTLLVVFANALYKINAETGEPLWHAPLSEPPDTRTLLILRDGLALRTGPILRKFRLADGKQAWKTRLLVNDAGRAAPWMQLARDSIYVVGPSGAAALSASTGQWRWRTPLPDTDLRDARLTHDSIVTLERASAPASATAAAQPPDRAPWIIRRFDRPTGRELPVTPDGPLRIQSDHPAFDWALCDDGLLLADGPRLLLYSGPAAVPGPRP